MRLKKQLELIDPRVWRDKNIKFETKLIYKILLKIQSIKSIHKMKLLI